MRLIFILLLIINELNLTVLAKDENKVLEMDDR